MASLNKVLLIGNLTRDPEVKFLNSGQQVGDLRLAVSEKYKNKAGEMVETTCFVDVVVWGSTAENCGKYLRKGAPIFVEGRLKLDEWKAKDGTNRSQIRVQADRVQFLSLGRRDEGEIRSGVDPTVGGGGEHGPDPVVVEKSRPPDPPLPDEDNLPF